MRPSRVQSLTRTTGSRRNLPRTARSTRATAAGSPRRSASLIAGSTIPSPASRVIRFASSIAPSVDGHEGPYAAAGKVLAAIWSGVGAENVKSRPRTTLEWQGDDGASRTRTGDLLGAITAEQRQATQTRVEPPA